MEYSEIFVRRIRQLSKERGFAINKLAKRSGINQSTLDNIVRGLTRDPRISTLHKVALGFNMTLAEFLDFSELNDYSFDEELEVVFLPAEVIDLFCGIGGLTCGLRNAGLDVIAGFDIDATCRYAYEHNNGVGFYQRNVRNLRGEDLADLYGPNTLRVLVGCAPCQPFSQMRSKLGTANELDEKYNLLTEYGRLIEELRPAIISMENVPQLQKTNVFTDFLALLERNGYYYDMSVIYCPDYGIPQTRRRFVLIGSQLGPVKIIPPTHNRSNIHVRDYIKDLPRIVAGEVCATDQLHQSANLTDINLRRIRASIPGGTWRDWPPELRCKCHTKESGKTYSSVYGRMTWDQIGPTITTQFHCYGTGRYGHPEQDRALSLREGAMLQTFPVNYSFIDPNVPFIFRDIARHIGNAVPVRLGEIIGMSILNHIEQLEE